MSERTRNESQYLRKMSDVKGKPFRICKAKPTWSGTEKLLNSEKGGYYIGGRLPTVEETGKGELLCCLGYECRFFRSSEENIKKNVNSFIKKYQQICKDYDEDPDPHHMYVDAVSLNDLYRFIGISNSHFGHQWVYPNTEEYRVDLKYKFTHMKKDELKGTTYEGINEDLLLIEPDSNCYPIDVEYLELYY